MLINCIIYYNMPILSDLFLCSESQGNAARIAMLRLVSLVAWQHINFYGRYEFSRKPELIDMKAILQQLMQLPL
ncbi:Tn3 family transposase [Acaryochloris thomasi]|nr:Tn3 family transposase [Acaryochloris thomasi]